MRVFVGFGGKEDGWYRLPDVYLCDAVTDAVAVRPAASEGKGLIVGLYGRLLREDGTPAASATLTVTATLGDRAVTKTLTLYPPMTVARVDWTPRRTILWPGDVLEAASITILVNRGGGQQLLTDHSEIAFRLTASGPTGYWSAEGTALAIPRNAAAATSPCVGG